MRPGEANTTINPRGKVGARALPAATLELDHGEAVQHPARRALVADDDPVVVNTLQRILTKRGFEVATARDGEEAWVLATTVDFDVLVTDLDMPRSGGLELFGGVRDVKPELPVIFVTGKPTLDSAVEAMNSGAIAYIQKPFEPSRVVEVVEKATKGRPRPESIRPEGQDAQAHFDAALEGLLLHYQPIVSWSRQRAFSYEALMRTSFAGVPHPGAFLDLAESLGRVHELGREVRNAAAREMVSNSAAPELLFVNLHPDELKDASLYQWDTSLGKVASRIYLEVTERESLRGMPDVHERIAALKDIGFRIAIDDIGAGYSGLNSFVDLEPELVKIDMGLVRGIDTCGRRQKLVGSLLQLANDLNIQAVAEGVETEAELDTLLELQCDLFQGYLFARPGEGFPAPTLPAVPQEAS